VAEIAEFHDPRLVAIYDAVNGYGPGEQPDLCAGVAAEVGARTVADLGCGTGMVSLHLAGLGYEVTGVDPSPAMLAVARAQPGAGAVRWRVGGPEQLDAGAADLAVMTGHVAQFLLTDDALRTTLAGLHRALRPGGRLAFESRDPRAREWERWTREASSTRVVDAVAGPVETWSEAEGGPDADGVVPYANHYVFARTGEHLVSSAALRFRSEDELRAALAETGFAVDRIHGDWDLRPVGPTTPELIVIAST
jgi:SAM-dependent methyltransferase